MFKGKNSGHYKMAMPENYRIHWLAFSSSNGVALMSLLDGACPLFRLACGQHQNAGWYALPGGEMYSKQGVVTMRMEVESGNEWTFVAFAQRIQ